VNAPRFYFLAALAFAVSLLVAYFGSPVLAGAIWLVVVLLLVASEILYRFNQLDAAVAGHQREVRRLIENARNRKELQP